MEITGFLQLPGEPAIVINGLPPMSPGDDLDPSYIVNDTKQQGNRGFGEWLVGREVRKLFGEQLYGGKVSEFDEEMGWYRVVYEDGDFEDLEWHELEEVLQPLDIMVPLKTVATKIIRRQQKSLQKSIQPGAGSRNQGMKTVKGKEKKSISSETTISPMTSLEEPIEQATLMH